MHTSFFYFWGSYFRHVCFREQKRCTQERYTRMQWHLATHIAGTYASLKAIGPRVIEIFIAVVVNVTSILVR